MDVVGCYNSPQTSLFVAESEGMTFVEMAARLPEFSCYYFMGTAEMRDCNMSNSFPLAILVSCRG